MLNLLRHPFGPPLDEKDLAQQSLPKRFALPIFSSDALSSVAYATDQILTVLALAGVAYFGRSMDIALIITAMLAILLLSYRQIIFSYPNGGGAYIVARDQLGDRFAQIAAAALLIDYTLTVAVSISSGVANFSSGLSQFFPSVPPFSANVSVIVALGVLALMWYVNMRGLREAGRAFAIPTYFFLVSVLFMLGVGFVRLLTGGLGDVEDVPGIIQATESMSLFLMLRAFASGSTAVTGIEAISNGIPSFQEPRTRNAATTMTIMCALLAVMFLGITKLSLETQVQASTTETVISQLGRTVFSPHSPFFVALIFATAGILMMAANTSFAGFPRLAALMAADGFLPRWLADRDNRLVYGIGITVLALAAGLLITVFRANVSSLIPLYAIGVFLSFTISQSGMVRRWHRVSRLHPGDAIPRYSPEGTLVTTLTPDRRWLLKLASNALGAVTTATVAVVFAVAKFSEGAWITLLLIPTLVLIFLRIHTFYRTVQERLAIDGLDVSTYVHTPVPRVRILVVGSLLRHVLAGLRDLTQVHGQEVDCRAVHVRLDQTIADDLTKHWQTLGLEQQGLPLTVLSPDPGSRTLAGTLAAYVREVLKENPRAQVELLIPSWSTTTVWWRWLLARLLHRFTGTRLRVAFLGENRVTVTILDYLVGSEP
jgi:amino acid transporter